MTEKAHKGNQQGKGKTNHVAHVSNRSNGTLSKLPQQENPLGPRGQQKRGGGMQKRRAWISMPAQVEYQGAGASRMIGLSGFCVLSRATESWLEALRDEERLKLEQPSVTFAGSFFSWSKKKKGRSQELDGGAAEGIGMSRFQI
jgi:hypothetical protein